MNGIVALGSLLIFQSALASGFGDKRKWDRISDPLIMDITNRDFSSLPLTGAPTDTGKYWSSDFWARNKGGINYRWNAKRPSGFNLISPTKEEAATWSVAQLSTLSASEKFDLFVGKYNYPLKKEVGRWASPTSSAWNGICNGWAGASMNENEPKPKLVANPDGIMIPFGSSDIKALLSWYYAKKFSNGHDQMGSRCNDTTGRDYRCTQDLNAGAFHLVLTNRLGKQGLPFIADMDKGHEVWNHIAYKYSSKIQSANLPPLSTSAPGTVKVVKMQMIVHYVWLLRRNVWDPVLGTSKQRLQTRTYRYYLDLNANGEVIGGDWISGQRPDFLWLSKKAVSFGGNMSRLGELL